MQTNGTVALFGDLHNHCGISYGHGDLPDALANAALRLDFVSVTGHADWPDMDADDPRIAHIVDFHQKGFAKLRSLWDRHLGELAAFEQQRGVITFPGYEIHSNEHGDYTIVGREHDLGMILADTPMALRNEFRARFGGDGPPPVMLFPHHLGYRPGARGVNWASFEEAFSPVVEVYSMHGLAENDRSDKPSLHSMGPFQAYGTVQRGLSLGHRFGVLGNTDHHSGHPGSYGHGMSGVWSTSRDRADLWSAINERRTWAMTGDTVRLWFEVDGLPMGSVVPGGIAGKPVRIEAEATAPIDYVELVVDGRREGLWWQAPDGDGAASEVIVGLELGWGERGVPFNWDVTMEVDGGTIEEVIPRFRGPEVVSPLDKKGDTIPTNHAGWQLDDERRVSCRTMTWGNMTNSTPSTQGLALRLDAGRDSAVAATMNARTERYSVTDLLAGSRSGNLGPIDSPAFLFSAVPVAECSRSVSATIDAGRPASWAYARVRLTNGHWAISSPVFAG